MSINQTSEYHKQLDHLYKTISSKQFLDMQGLGNEVPFFICPYDPENFNEMSDNVYKPLKRKLKNNGIKVVAIDLYDLSIDIIKDRKLFERIVSNESSWEKSELLELLQGILDPENHLAPKIEKKLNREFDVVFITGVGQVFPYIRSHTILNNLQSKIKTKPMVMFFPGKYTQSIEAGSSLNLFGRILDDNYYRAFNIYNHFNN